MHTLVFDIETVPDVEGGRRLYHLSNLNDKEVAEKMREIRLTETHQSSDFLRLHLQRIIVISAVIDTGNKIKVWSLGENDSDEKEIIQRFFDGIEKYSPQLISWNGGGFDLPVLHYRALLHGISAPRYWETGEEDSNFRWNNYLNRYHYRHLDLMDVLACYQSRAAAPLDEIAVLLGFPGKMGMEGSQVWDAFLQGELQKIRHYCETDVLNTYLVFMRFELMRGKISQSEYTQKLQKLRDLLIHSSQPHLEEFAHAWKS